MPKFLPPVLETERLILRPLSIDDLQTVFKWTGDPRVNKYMIYPLYKSPEDGREWLESLYEDEKKFLRVRTRHRDNSICGFICSFIRESCFT